MPLPSRFIELDVKIAMTEFIDLLAEKKTPESNKVIAAQINENPTEFIGFLKSTFEVAGSDDRKHRILDIIDYFSPKLVIATVQHAIMDESERIRVRGLQAAYRLRVDSLNNEIAAILNDSTQVFNARKWSIHILSSTDPESYSRLLREIARFGEKDLDLRKEAIFALTKIVSDETIGLLCILLGDSEVEIRKSSAWALNSIQSPESINCLLAGLDDVDEEVRDWSIRALRDMDDTRALEKLSEALLRSPPAEQVRMIRLIVERRSDVILRAIVTLLDSESTAVRRVAAWAMGVSPYPPAVPSLRALLDDADEEVRSYAKVALIRSGGIDPSDLQI
jgi:hypothetical protein